MAGKYDHIDFKPPESVANAAKRGLEYRKKQGANKAGLTQKEASKQGIGSGVQRASNLKNGSKLSPETVRQMSRFFSRHEKNKAIDAENKGTPWKDKGYVAWLLWGGDAGKSWADKVIRQMDAADKKSGKGLEDACWDGYEAIGTKIKDGRRVPNCVPKKKAKGKGIPNAQERAAFDIPLARWANAMGGRGVELRAPQVKQKTNYSCGPAALRSGMAALGVGAKEDELAEKAETSASGGTSVHGLAKAADAFGLEASVETGMTVDRLMECMDEGCVVLVCLQAGDDVDEYDSSHWVLPVAVKDEAGEPCVECMDPSRENVHSVMKLDEFEERWHCVDMGKPVNGLCLVVRGDSPANMTLIKTAKMPM